MNREETIENYYNSTTEYEYACHDYEEPTIYFNKEWEEINCKHTIKETDYFINIYPLNIFENDEICIRVYKGNNEEYGNGIYIDSDFGIIEGNDELYFTDDEEENNYIKDEILNKVNEVLKEENII